MHTAIPWHPVRRPLLKTSALTDQHCYPKHVLKIFSHHLRLVPTAHESPKISQERKHKNFTPRCTNMPCTDLAWSTVHIASIPKNSVECTQMKIFAVTTR